MKKTDRKPVTALKRMRVERYLSQLEVARRCAITQQTVSYQESTGIFRKSTALRYAAIFECRWQDLID